MSIKNIMSQGFKKRQTHLIRKLVVKNLDESKGTLFFEVGRYCSQHKPELGEISAILKRYDESTEMTDLIHDVYVRKPSEEEVLWKRVYRDRIEEFDIS